MKTNILYMTIGLPRSGKSTWAKLQQVPTVNPDAIRLSVHGKPFDLKHEDLVWWTARIMVESLFKAGHRHVILDATNITRSRRDRWYTAEWERVFVSFGTSPEMCKKRAIASDMPYLVDVIEKMSGQYEPSNLTTEYVRHMIDGDTNPRISL